MSINTGARFQLKNGEPLEALKFNDSREAAIASTGQINASDYKDLMGQISKFMAAAQSKQIVTASNKKNTELLEQRRRVFAAASIDPVKWNQLGTVLAAEIQEAAERNGFLRNLVVEEPLSQGQIPRIRVRYPNVVGVVATSAAEVSPQLIRDKYFYPAEFAITANIEIEEREIAQATGDILDEKYREGLAAVMVTEDRMWKAGADETVGLENPLSVISGGLTPNYLYSIMNLVTRWNLPQYMVLLANDFWPDIATNTNWQGVFDPVSQAEILLTGKIGTIYGMEVRTDGFRPPEQKVLETGELYVTSQPTFHGAITTRGGVEPTPLNGPVNGRVTRGWFLAELLSFMICNSRSLAKGIRGS